MNPIELKAALKEKARQLGFPLVGITTPDPPEHFPIFKQWVDAGHHAGMAYLAAERSLERRADPRAILPECQSILVLAVPYQPQSNPPANIAAYAWGEDYHEVLPPKLQALVEFLEAAVGEEIPNRWYTDTGPLLERELAQRAGLGWVGKNSMLIHPQTGSYFFLAEILLGISLPPDDPFTTDHCGTCRRCIEACPTACIREDRTLEAGRCISYLTIENKGVIPPDLRPKIGAWVFGCDICQVVCPWNRFAPSTGQAAFERQARTLEPHPAEAFSLTPQAFNARFKGSPIKRTKRRGYLRNAAVAAGNAKQPADVPQLIQALQDSEPLVRGHAAWALGQIGGGQAQAALHSALESEEDEGVRGEIELSLRNYF